MKSTRRRKISIPIKKYLMIFSVTLIKLTVLGALVFLSCSTAGDDPEKLGNCKVIDNGGKYIAPPFDPDGKEWKFNLLGQGDFKLKCSKEDDKGTIRISGSIQDGRGQLKPGIQTNLGLFGASSFIVFDEDDPRNQLISDSCGMVMYYLSTKCPGQTLSVSAVLYGYSGGLKSKESNITIENYVQPTATPAPAASAAPNPNP